MRQSILSGLVVVGTVVAAGKDAWAFGTAAPKMGTIGIAGGIVQNGDPSYTYQLGVIATGGTVTLDSGSIFTMSGLVGVDMSSVIDESPPQSGLAFWMTSIDVTGSVTEGDVSYSVSTVSWDLVSGSYTAANAFLLTLAVTTDTTYSASLPDGYPTYLTTGVSYSDMTEGSATNIGMTTSTGLSLIQGGVPEPSTLAYAICALASLPVVSFFKRWRPRLVGRPAA